MATTSAFTFGVQVPTGWLPSRALIQEVMVLTRLHMLAHPGVSVPVHDPMPDADTV